MQREEQARQGCLSVCAQGLCKDAKPTKHTQTLTPTKSERDSADTKPTERSYGKGVGAKQGDSAVLEGLVKQYHPFSSLV